MQGLQGVRNLRDLFNTKYHHRKLQQDIDHSNENFNHTARQTHNQWRYKQLNKFRLPLFDQTSRKPSPSPQKDNNIWFTKGYQIQQCQQDNNIFKSKNNDALLHRSTVIANRQNDQNHNQSTSRRASPIPQLYNSNNNNNINVSFLNSSRIVPEQVKQHSIPKNKQSDSDDFNLKINRNIFVFHYVIGKGGFGKVWKVESKKSKKIYAMKEMQKAKILAKKSVHSVMNEKILLGTLKYNFIVNMIHSFQDRDNLYLLLDYITGGDLRYHIGKRRFFKEHQTSMKKFFICCLILSLEYLHSKNIIHRDIKPENLLLDQQGYVRVTDLGIARLMRTENSQDTSGTPGYMAPEVMCRQNHSFGVDYYAMGVIGYEFMLGRRPYVGRSRREIRDQILAKQVQIKRNELPDYYSVEAADFVNKLIQRKPSNRLGYNGIDEIKNHPWVKDFPWQLLEDRQLEAPYIPQSIDDNFEFQQQISLDNETLDELILQNQQLLRRASVQRLFDGYNQENNVKTKHFTPSTSTTNPDNRISQIKND